MDGSMNLRIPCVKKIKPTASRMKTMLLTFQAGARSLFTAFLDGRACTYMADRPMSLRNPRRQMIALGYPRMLSNFDIEIR